MNVSTAFPSGSVAFPAYSSLSARDLSLLSLLLLLYLAGLMVTSLLVAVIVWDGRLRRPMHVLLAHLSLCGVLGGSALCPTVLHFLALGETRLSLAECLTQVFFLNLYSGCMFCLLGLMALDRYVAIVFPLRYHAVVTPARLRLSLLCVYTFLVSLSVVQVYLTSRVRLCRFSIDKLTCDPLAIASLACERTFVISAFGLFASVSVIILPSLLIVLSYTQIFIVVFKTSRESRKKALKTCAPHLITFANFSMASFFAVISRRMNDSAPKTLNIAVSLVFLIFPPLLNPIVYGIKTREIQQSLRKTLHRTRLTHTGLTRTGLTHTGLTHTGLTNTGLTRTGLTQAVALDALPSVPAFS